MLQDLPTGNPILDAAKRELAPRAQATAPLRTANDAYDGAAYITSIDTSAHKGTRKTPVAGGHDTAIEQFGFMDDIIGTVEVGKYADLVVLDTNILEVDPTAISDARVVYTISDGRIVYKG